MFEAQARALAPCRNASSRNGDGTGEPLRCDTRLLTHWLGMPVDLLLRLEIAPASISTVEIGPWGPRILRINEEA